MPNTFWHWLNFVIAIVCLAQGVRSFTFHIRLQGWGERAVWYVSGAMLLAVSALNFYVAFKH